MSVLFNAARKRQGGDAATQKELEETLVALHSAREALKAMVFGTHIAAPEGELSAVPFPIPLLAPGDEVSANPLPIPGLVEGVDVRVVPLQMFIPVQQGEVCNVALPPPCLVHGQVSYIPIPLPMPA